MLPRSPELGSHHKMRFGFIDWILFWEVRGPKTFAGRTVEVCQPLLTWIKCYCLQIHTHIHSCVRTCTYTYTHNHTHKHAHTHTNTHTHTHTHIYIYIYIYIYICCVLNEHDFSTNFQRSVFFPRPWSLNDRKSPQISGTLLNIQADLIVA